MLTAVQELGQRQVVARSDGRSRAHGRAEAGAAGLAAVHRDDERPLPARCVVRVGEGASDQHPVLDRDGVKLAGPDAEEGQGRSLGCGLIGEGEDALLVPARVPEPYLRREQLALPRVRPDGVPEAGRVVSLLEPIAPRRLHVGHADRQLVCRVDLGVDDGAAAHRRSDDAVAELTKRPNEAVQALEVDHEVVTWHPHRHPCSRAARSRPTLRAGREPRSPTRRRHRRFSATGLRESRSPPGMPPMRSLARKARLTTTRRPTTRRTR